MVVLADASGQRDQSHGVTGAHSRGVGALLAKRVPGAGGVRVFAVAFCQVKAGARMQNSGCRGGLRMSRLFFLAQMLFRSGLILVRPRLGASQCIDHVWMGARAAGRAL